MTRLFIRLISFLIFDKAKRKRFREKYDIVNKLRKEWRGELNSKFERQIGVCLGFTIQEVKDRLSDIILFPDSPVLLQNAIKNGFVSNYQEHINNLKNLKANLDFESLNNLEVILKKLDKLNYDRAILLTDYYSEEEYHIYEKTRIIKYNTEKVDDHYEYNGYKLPINYFEPSVFLYKHGLNKLKTLNKSYLKTGAIIDVGGFILDSVLIFREISDGKIISFEPGTSNYKIGMKTLKLNKLENVIYEKLALLDYEGSCNILKNYGAGNSIIKEIYGYHKYEKVKCTTLDSYVDKYDLKVRLIKIDIEGCEQQFLKGAVNTIKEQRPILLISIYHNYNDFYKIKPWLESLNLGYRFNFFKGIDFRHYYEIMLLAEVYN